MKVLILTDHHKHSNQNSVYGLAARLSAHADCDTVYLASRGSSENDDFFKHKSSLAIKGIVIHSHTDFNGAQQEFKTELVAIDLKTIDFIWLRLARPLDTDFFDHLLSNFKSNHIFNHPRGISEAGSKAFLLNFPQLCAPMIKCTTMEDILYFSKKYTIVLKPLDNYGGKGIVKIENGKIWEGNNDFSLEEYTPILQDELDKGGYLGMKYLKNVGRGDKRIIVVNGKIVGASLRKPQKGSWISNASQGASSHRTRITKEERHIAQVLSPKLKEYGVVMYGFDTLTDDNGKRVLSEINTASIGGVVQSEELSGQPVVQRVVDGLCDYMNDILK